MSRAVVSPPTRVAGRPPVRVGRLSGIWRPRLCAVTVIGLGLLVLVSALNIGRGDFPISPGEVLNALAGGGDAAQRLIVVQLRLPRTLTGLLVGAALGVAGAITQRIARNPLASPDLLGVTAGAGAAAVAVIALGGGGDAVLGLLAGAGLPGAAVLGGLAATALVYGLSYRDGVDGGRLVLVGVGVTAVASAITSWLLVVADITEATQATVWLTGSLNARGWEHVGPIAVTLAVLLPVGLLLSFSLGTLELGDDTARSLGLRVDAVRTGLLLVALGLAAVATASAGPIAFVALVVPQVCQRLVGSAAPPLLPSSVFGGLLVVLADLVTRTLLPAALPVGIVTAAVGAPYLLYLLIRRNRGVNV